MQCCVSHQEVIEARYATKCEPRSQPLKEIFTAIVRYLKEDSTSLKAVQKLLINSVGERDYSAQETCHLDLLLQMHMFRASQDFDVLSLDGSHAVEEHLAEDQPATVLSALDHYVAQPATPQFQGMTLLHFVQHFSMPKESESEPSLRWKKFVVIVRPYCFPDPHGPRHEQLVLSTKSQNDCVWDSWNWEVLPDLLPETSPQQPCACCSTHWCGSLQHRRSQPPLPSQPNCPG